MNTPQDPVREWMNSLGFELTFDTGLKSYYNKRMQRVINAEAAQFFYQQMTISIVKGQIYALEKMPVDAPYREGGIVQTVKGRLIELEADLAALTQQSKLDGGK